MVSATPSIIRVPSTSGLDKALLDNVVQIERPVLVCVGGAAGISAPDLASLAELFRVQLIPMIDERAITVVDGGTDAGIMRLIGQAREAIGGSFQLIGVAAEGTVQSSDSAEPRSGDGAEIEPNHTHIVLVPGDSWGDETPWLSAIAAAVAGRKPSATLVINGGSITLDDALTSLQAGRPTIVIEGSGRASDEIADARAGKPAGVPAGTIADSELTTIVPMHEPDRILQAIRRALTVTDTA
jgi:hypothetical protein